MIPIILFMQPSWMRFLVVLILSESLIFFLGFMVVLNKVERTQIRAFAQGIMRRRQSQSA
jgi:hypothetical protein